MGGKTFSCVKTFHGQKYQFDRKSERSGFPTDNFRNFRGVFQATVQYCGVRTIPALCNTPYSFRLPVYLAYEGYVRTVRTRTIVNPTLLFYAFFSKKKRMVALLADVGPLGKTDVGLHAIVPNLRSKSSLATL